MNPMTSEEKVQLTRHCEELAKYAIEHPFKGIMEMASALPDQEVRNRYARVIHAAGFDHQVVFTVLQETGKHIGCVSIYGELQQPNPEVCDLVCRILLPRGATDVTQDGLHDPTSRKFGGIV